MGWKLTATTLFCKTVKNWVPIIVYNNGRTHCGYYYRHKVVTTNNNWPSQCHGPNGCSLCESYKEDVFHRSEAEKSVK